MSTLTGDELLGVPDVVTTLEREVVLIEG